MSNKAAQYGGAVFDVDCPRCGQVCQTPTDMSINTYMADFTGGRKNTIEGICPKHGKVKLPELSAKTTRTEQR
jgi:hypothetical protein